MNWFDRMFKLGTKVIMLSEKTSELSENVKGMTADFHEMDKRLAVAINRIDNLERNYSHIPMHPPYPPYPSQRPRLDYGQTHENDPDPDPGE